MEMGPGSRPARQERSRLTRRKILDAARAALSDSGWEGLAIARVAAAAGVSVGSVYERFTDKSGLVSAVQHDVLDAVDDDLRTGFANLSSNPPESAAVLLDQALRVLVSPTDRHGSVMAPLILRAATDTTLHERGNATRVLAEELFVDLLEVHAELFDPSPPTVAIRVAFRAMFGSAMWDLTFGMDPDAHPISVDVVQRERTALCQAYLLGGWSARPPSCGRAGAATRGGP